jgi:hypothetical protein
MPSTSRFLTFLAAVVLATGLSAQTISSAFPGFFVDLTPAGLNGTEIIPGDDSSHQIVTTIGNGLFPAGAVTLRNNGVASAAANALGPNTNADIPLTGVPAGLTATANGILLPYWDNLFPNPATPCRIYWKEFAGVLYIEWYREDEFFASAPGQDITFQIQVFGAPAPGAPWIQFVYPDATFGGTAAAFDHGLSATVGWVKGANPIGQNAKWSFNTASVPDGLVLSILPPMLLDLSSPSGPGSLRVDLSAGPPSGTYFLCATLNPGSYPNGYFFGITPSFQEILTQANAGWPFVFGLDAAGAATIGPFPAFSLPSGLGLYAVALGFDTPFLDYPSSRSGPKNHVIP